MSERETPVQSPDRTPTQTPRLSPVQILETAIRKSTNIDRNHRDWRLYALSQVTSSSRSKQDEYHAQMALWDNQQEDNAIATAQTELDDLSRTLGVTHLALENKSQNGSGVATATAEYY